MGLRRPGVIKEYEEMPGTNVPAPSKHTHHHNHHHSRNQNHSGQHPQRINNQTGGDMAMCQDLEMSSVSVVPDGEDWIFFLFLLLELILFPTIFFVFFFSHI